MGYGDSRGSGGRGTRRGVGYCSSIRKVLGRNNPVERAFARMRATVEEVLLPYLPEDSRITAQKVSVMCPGHMHEAVSLP